jgi:GNAT superfamily N-acetyltransferase
MTDRADAEPAASLAAAWRWQVRPASVEEAPVVAAAARALLRELDATPPAADAMEEAARTLIADRNAGEVFLADAGGAIVGMLAASWQVAIHIPGRYGLIQDLWVHRDWRSQTVGQGLIDALVAAAQRRQITRIEVGVPRDGWPHLEATRRFYLRNEFGTIGGRLRRELA